MNNQHRRLVGWWLAAAFGIICLGLGIYFCKIGLDRSSTVSGVIGLFASLAGIAISIYGVFQAQATTSPSASVPVRQRQTSGKNSTNIQAGGDISIGDKNKLGRSDR